MSEEIENVAEEANENVSEMNDDALKNAIETQMKKIRSASILSGSKAICHVILEYILEFQMEPGKKTFRQQERLIKKIQNFCETGVSRKINENGEIVPVEKEEIDT